MRAPTTVIHAVEPDDVHSTKVEPLPNDLIEIRYGGGDGGDCLILVKGQWSVVHDRFVVIRRVKISYIVILILVEIVLLPCKESDMVRVELEV